MAYIIVVAKLDLLIGGAHYLISDLLNPSVSFRNHCEVPNVVLNWSLSFNFNKSFISARRGHHLSAILVLLSVAHFVVPYPKGGKLGLEIPNIEWNIVVVISVDQTIF